MRDEGTLDSRSSYAALLGLRATSSATTAASCCGIGAAGDDAFWGSAEISCGWSGKVSLARAAVGLELAGFNVTSVLSASDRGPLVGFLGLRNCCEVRPSAPALTEGSE